MFPSLTCGGPVLLGQGVTVVFDPQVVIVTWWVRWGQQGHRPSQTTGVVTRPKPEAGTSVPTTTKHPAGGGGGAGTPTEVPTEACFMCVTHIYVS